MWTFFHENGVICNLFNYRSDHRKCFETVALEIMAVDNSCYEI